MTSFTSLELMSNAPATLAARQRQLRDNAPSPTTSPRSAMAMAAAAAAASTALSVFDAVSELYNRVFANDAMVATAGKSLQSILCFVLLIEATVSLAMLGDAAPASTLADVMRWLWLAQGILALAAIISGCICTRLMCRHTQNAADAAASAAGEAAARSSAPTSPAYNDFLRAAASVRELRYKKSETKLLVAEVSYTALSWAIEFAALAVYLLTMHNISVQERMSEGIPPANSLAFWRLRGTLFVAFNALILQVCVAQFVAVAMAKLERARVACEQKRAATAANATATAAAGAGATAGATAGAGAAATAGAPHRSANDADMDDTSDIKGATAPPKPAGNQLVSRLALRMSFLVRGGGGRSGSLRSTPSIT